MVSQLEERRQKIIALYQQGLYPQQIARRMHMKLPFVSRWIHRFFERGHVKDAPRGGRKKKLVPRLVNKLHRAAKLRKGQSIRKLAATYKGKGIDISPTSIWRGLHACGLKAFRRQRKPAITKEHKKQRLSYARKHKQRVWKRVVFADEKVFYLGTLPNRKNDIVWADTSDEVEPHATARVQGKVNVYAAISREGQTELHVFEQNMTGNYYKAILQNTLLPTTSLLYPRASWAYVQDNDPKHRSKVAVDYISKICPEPIFLPPYSPDLNPMENVWATVGEMVAQSEPKTVAGMVKQIKKAWKQVVTPHFREVLFDTYSHRLEEVISLKGARTKY